MTHAQLSFAMGLAALTLTGRTHIVLLNTLLLVLLLFVVVVFIIVAVLLGCRRLGLGRSFIGKGQSRVCVCMSGLVMKASVGMQSALNGTVRAHIIRFAPGGVGVCGSVFVCALAREDFGGIAGSTIAGVRR